MDHLLHCFAGAVVDGPDCPEWKYLYSSIIPDFEVKGYKLARPMNLLQHGERNIDSFRSICDNHEVSIIQGILDIVNEGNIRPVSLFAYAFCEAIQANNASKLEEYLRIGYPVNAVCHHLKTASSHGGITALHFAVERGFEPLIRILLSHGADYSLVDEDGDSPMSMAIAREKHPIVRLMISAGGNVHKSLQDCVNYINNRNRHPFEPLLASWTDNDIALLKLFTENFVTIPNLPYEFNVTKLLLHRIQESIQSPPENLRFSQIEMTSILIKLGCDVNRPFEQLQTNSGAGGITPLFLACNFGNERLVRLLLENGCTVDQSTDSNIFPIEISLFGTSPCENVAILLVEKGSDPNRILNTPRSTVTYAAVVHKQWYRLFEMCLSRGADPNIECESGRTLLCAAARDDYREVLHSLVNVARVSGFALDIVLNRRESQTDTWPMLVSVACKQQEFTKLLLEAGADPNLLTKSSENRSCLHIAVLEGDFYTTRMLIDHGANVNVRSRDRLPRPLDFAINRGHEDIAIYLVEHGSDPYETIEDVNGSPQSILFANESLQVRLKQAWDLRSTGSALTRLSVSPNVNPLTSSELHLPPIARTVPTKNGSESPSSGVVLAVEMNNSPSQSSTSERSSARDFKQSPQQPTVSSPKATLSPRSSPLRNAVASAGGAAWSPAGTSKRPIVITGGQLALNAGRSQSSAGPVSRPSGIPSVSAKSQDKNKVTSGFTVASASGSSSGRDNSSSTRATQLTKSSAEPHPSAVASSVEQTSIEGSDSRSDLFSMQECCICMENKKNASIIHGGTGHVCCCIACARRLKDRGDPCPVCRQRIDLVVELFVS